MEVAADFQLDCSDRASAYFPDLHEKMSVPACSALHTGNAHEQRRSVLCERTFVHFDES